MKCGAKVKYNPEPGTGSTNFNFLYNIVVLKTK